MMQLLHSLCVQCHCSAAVHHHDIFTANLIFILPHFSSLQTSQGAVAFILSCAVIWPGTIIRCEVRQFCLSPAWPGPVTLRSCLNDNLPIGGNILSGMRCQCSSHQASNITVYERLHLMDRQFRVLMWEGRGGTGRTEFGHRGPKKKQTFLIFRDYDF